MQYFPSGSKKGITCWEKRARYTYFLILPWGEEKKKKDTSTGNWRRVSPLGSYSSCASGTLPWEICHHPIWEIHYHRIIEQNASTLLNGRNKPSPNLRKYATTHQRNTLFPPYCLSSEKYATTLSEEIHHHPFYKRCLPLPYLRRNTPSPQLRKYSITLSEKCTTILLIDETYHHPTERKPIGYWGLHKKICHRQIKRNAPSFEKFH